MDYQSWVNLAFRVNFHVRNRRTEHINEEVEGDENLTNNRNVYAIRSSSEPVIDHSKRSKFEERCYPLAEESLVLRLDTVATTFAIKISTNQFEHGS